jgi:3-deoxy-7-phosphoheptulonate synthase
MGTIVRQTHNINIRELIPLVSPRELLADLPMTDSANETVVSCRESVKRILSGEDKRLLVVVGPCSIHDEQACLEYAQKLAALSRQVAERLLLVMRVYFEKPRTTVGWKGLINDPHLNDTFDIQTGLRRARQILLKVGEMGVPAATEMLEPIPPQYIADLVTLASIGARTTESPTHRQMASGLSMPVGFKNATDGDLQIAIDAMEAARHPHAFVGIDGEGHTCIVQTNGNPWGHLVLRGGRSGPNYAAEHLERAAERLIVAGLSPRLLVDCSHANSNKDFHKQCLAWKDVVAQRSAGNDSIIGMMLESNLVEGKQKLQQDPAKLKYGVSITDGCIGWEETSELILDAHRQLAAAKSESSSVNGTSKVNQTAGASP